MTKLPIQNWIKNINDYYISFSHLKKLSNDIKTYNKLIQEMQAPSDFENLNDFYSKLKLYAWRYIAEGFIHSVIRKVK